MTSSSSVASSAPASIERRRSAPPSCARSCRSRARRSSGRPSALIAMSMYWPSHRARQVSSYRRIRRSTVRSGKPRSVSRWRAIRDRLNSVSPVLIAWGTPWMVHSVGRWRRSTSPSSMSSWTRLKLWPSSTAAAPGSARWCSPVMTGVGEQAEQRPHPLAARGTRTVEREVVADHLVEAVGRRIAVLRRGGRSRPRCRRSARRDRCSEDVVVMSGRVYTKRVPHR